jgi:DNA primase
MRVRVVTLPEGEDPDSFLRQHTGEEFLRHVNAAVSFVDYLLTRAARFADLRSPAGRADCVDRLSPLLRKIENQVERWGYVAFVAERLGVPPEVLQRQMYPHQTPREHTPYQAPVRPRRPPSPTPVSPEYALLQMLCHNVRLLEQVQHQVSPEDFHDADLRAIYTVLADRAPEGGPIVFPRMLEEAANPRQMQLLTQMAMESTLTNPTEVSAALHDCITKIRQRQPKAQRQRIIEQLRTVGDGTAEQQRLLQEYNRLSKEQPMSFS